MDDDTSRDRIETLERELNQCRSDLARSREREQLYHRVFESKVAGFGQAEIILDPQGHACDFRLLEVNEAFGRLTGFPPLFANGRTARELVPGLESCWIDTLAAVALTGEAARFENHVEKLGKWFEAIAYRIARGQFAFLLLDVTERKQNELTAGEQMKLAEAVFTSSISPLAVLDPDYNFLRVNEAYARAGRREMSEFAGRNHFEMYPSDAKSIFDEVVRTKRPYTTWTRAFVYANQPERGVTYWDWTLVPIFDNAGEVQYLIFSLMEVTERKRAEDALRENEARYRQLATELELIYRTAPIGLCVLDTELRYVHVNDRLAEINGIPAEEHLGKTVRQVIPLVADRIEASLRRVLATGEPFFGPESAETPAQPGVQRHWITQYWPLKSSDGAVFGINIVVEEITERRWLEESRAREHTFRTLAENSTDVVARFDRALRRIYVNPAIEAIMGRPRIEILGKTHREVGVPEEIADTLDCALREVFAAGQPKTKEGAVPTPIGERYFDTRLVPEFGPGGEVETVLTISRDITERKRIEDALRESEHKYRNLVENLYEGIWLIDAAGKTIFVNARMAELLGYRVDEMLGRHLFTFMDEAATEAARANLARGETGKRAEYEFRFLRKGGGPVWTQILTTPLFDGEGCYLGALAGVIDITKRRRAEEALKRREREFEALVESAPDIIARVDRTLRLLYINSAVEQFTGRPRAWFLGKSPAERSSSKQEAELWERALRRVFASGREDIVEHSISSIAGQRHFQSRLVPEFGPDGAVESVLLVDRDITELRRAQERLEQLTLTDPLTGVANRRYLERFVGREWRREARHRHPMAMIMADIDHFKAYNDRYGHPQGDECLRQVAGTLRQSLHRPADTLVRYGGEEFAVLLPETDLHSARELAERLRLAVEERELPHAASPLADRVTLSLGVAALNTSEGEFDQLMAAADAALYRAKHKGRNRVETNP